MAKILLVEDDNNLREIYEARLQAEGYDIVSAQDGESALVVAKRETPDLIISDVMMPRISGFEMLDILRNTEGLKNVKIIMLTALGQAEDKARADSLGADKYLVKSQVTLEDIVKSAAELLGEVTATPAAAATTTVPAAPAAPPVVPTAPAAPMPAASIPVASPTPQATIPVETPPQPQVQPLTMPTPVAPGAPLAQAAPAPVVAAPSPAPSVPITPAVAPAIPPPTAASTTDEQLVANAVQDLVSGTPGSRPTTPAVAPQPPSVPVPLTALPASTPTPAQPASVPPTPQPQAWQAPPVQQPVPVPDAASQNSDDTVKKKIIQPLSSDANPTPPDLHELLAKEGHTFDDQQPHNAGPHQPGHVISPNPVSPTGQPVDPNSIAL